MKGTRGIFISLSAAAALASGPVAAQAPENLPNAPAASAPLGLVAIYQLFRADGDPGQCHARAHGVIITPYNRWSPPIRIDSDNRPGGCQFNFAVIDPTHSLAGWGARMAFQPTGDGGQCGNLGIQNVQIVPSANTVNNARAIRIDTDDRSGGCRLTFQINGQGPALYIYFVPDGDAGQCQRPADLQVVRPGQTKWILIDTDGRSGGCLLQFRLR